MPLLGTRKKYLGTKVYPSREAQNIMPARKITAELEHDIIQALEKLESDSYNSVSTQEGAEKESLPVSQMITESVHESTLRNGLLALLGKIAIPDSLAWEDAMNYCRDVIESPQDTKRRANSEWVRSGSDLYFELTKRFGPGIIEAAQTGAAKLVDNHYTGNPLNIAHVDKKANMMRYMQDQHPSSIFNREPGLLALTCYEQTALCCSITISAWQPPHRAIPFGTIAHVGVCDDYHEFTLEERKGRLLLIALAAGAIYEVGGQAVNVVVDATALQAAGSGRDMSTHAARAWRAISGCTTAYSSYLWAQGSLKDEGLVAPEAMMAMHDLLDWRSDLAGRNHENGVSATYGLGIEDPHHDYLEDMLRRATTDPLSGAYAMASIVFLHFTATRYGAYNYYKGGGGGCGGSFEPCGECERLLKCVTVRAGLHWAPMKPPQSFAEGEPFRQLCRSVFDKFETHPLGQCGISWLQHLVTTGQIRLFDALVAIDPLDSTAGWV